MNEPPEIHVTDVDEILATDVKLEENQEKAQSFRAHAEIATASGDLPDGKGGKLRTVMLRVYGPEDEGFLQFTLEREKLVAHLREDGEGL